MDERGWLRDGLWVEQYRIKVLSGDLDEWMKEEDSLKWKTGGRKGMIGVREKLEQKELISVVGVPLQVERDEDEKEGEEKVSFFHPLNLASVW